MIYYAPLHCRVDTEQVQVSLQLSPGLFTRSMSSPPTRPRKPGEIGDPHVSWTHCVSWSGNVIHHLASALSRSTGPYRDLAYELPGEIYCRCAGRPQLSLSRFGILSFSLCLRLNGEARGRSSGFGVGLKHTQTSVNSLGSTYVIITVSPSSTHYQQPVTLCSSLATPPTAPRSIHY
jgi:hypothetical protein